MTEHDFDHEELEEEVQETRKGFDIVDRLVNRPKRKPEVVTVYLNEELGQELGSARDIHNDYGAFVRRQREGVIGEIDEKREVLANLEATDGDEDDIAKLKKEIATLERKAKKLVAEIKKDSLTFTLQWIPPIAEEAIERASLKAVGLKAKPVPEAKIEDYVKESTARLLVDTLVSLVDNSNGNVVDKIDIATAKKFSELLPKAQYLRLDAALGSLQHRNAIHNEAVDNADF